MNRRDTALLAGIQGTNAHLAAFNDRLDRVNARLDRTNERIDTIIDALAELRADLRAPVATHHHDDD